MVVRAAAVMLDDVVYVGAEGARHDGVIHDMLEVHGVQSLDGSVQGFVDHEGRFMDRAEAARHAFGCGQLPRDTVCPDAIVSEDLW